MRIYFSLIVTLILCFSCKDDKSSKQADYAYLGGEIINPNTNYLVLLRDKDIIDTITLDGRNRFMYKLEGLEEGIYTFRHGGEYQTILIEEQDSILFRLNTLDFDESLVYTGEGDKKNNYLINQFLENEREEKYVVKLCQLSPELYQRNIDSLRKVKTKKLETFKDKYEYSELFDKLAQGYIDYGYYAFKEVYPFVHYGKDKAAILKSLPDDFYDYRKDVNYNDEFFSNYYNYNTFLRYSFSNLSLEVHDEHDNTKCFNKKSVCYNLDRLKLIDSLVINPRIKEDLLYHFTTHYLAKSKDAKSNNAILTAYLDKSENEKNKAMLTRYTSSLNNLKEGSTLPIISLVSYGNNITDLNALVDKPTVVSFWSRKYYEHFEESHFKLKELKRKYPEVKFITINTDTYNLEKSKEILTKHDFDIQNEYFFENPKTSKEILAVHPMTKTIIIDKDKKLVDSNTNIFSVNFEEQLLGLLNK